MCGITGVVDHHGGRIDPQVLEKMRDVITHRGPDDKGNFIDDGIALAHRRLSIIDISTGHQPMFSADGNLCIVFNGEIYNYQDLRNELTGKGYGFSTKSDTEVIIYLYQEYAEECVKKLNGIFGFAIWDKRDRKLFIARDHMGIKPVYYYSDSGNFVFSSEIKSLFESGIVTPECETDAVPEYFVFRHVAGERTLFRNVKALLPGHYMTVSRGKVETKQYWNPIDCYVQRNLSFDEACEQLSALLQDAISMQMVSDVPLGTFCSGGIDSSLVTAIAAKQVEHRINTFSIGFNEADFDETEYARLVSDKYNTQHHELIVDSKEFSDYLPEMIWNNDEPLNYPNSIHIYALSKLAKEYVTVVLTGEGADELFGGYSRYHIARYMASLRKIPGPVRVGLGAILARTGERRLKKLATFFNRSIEETLLYNCATTDLGRISQLVESSYEKTFPYRAGILNKTNNTTDALRRVTLQDQHTYLLSILNRQDKMSMAASIESRVPILDYRIVEFANSLPARYKQRGTQTKVILKKVAEKFLPHDVIYRRKSGFGVPLDIWMRENTGMRELANDVLSQERLDELDCKIDVAKLLSKHMSGQNDYGEFIWTILNFSLWKKAFRIN